MTVFCHISICCEPQYLVQIAQSTKFPLRKMPKIVPLVILGFVCLIRSIRAEPEETGNDIHYENQPNKNGRFITLNNKGGDIKVELDFTIPFLKIPVGGSREHGGISNLDLNTKSLVSIGALLALLVTVVPKIVQLIIPDAQVTTAESLAPIMGRISEALSSSDISAYECYQRAGCWIASKANVNLLESSRGFQWMTGLINDAAMQEAIVRGMKGEDCTSYTCPLSLNAIQRMFMSNPAT